MDLLQLLQWLFWLNLSKTSLFRCWNVANRMEKLKMDPRSLFFRLTSGESAMILDWKFYVADNFEYLALPKLRKIAWKIRRRREKKSIFEIITVERTCITQIPCKINQKQKICLSFFIGNRTYFDKSICPLLYNPRSSSLHTSSKMWKYWRNAEDDENYCYTKKKRFQTEKLNLKFRIVLKNSEIQTHFHSESCSI